MTQDASFGPVLDTTDVAGGDMAVGVAVHVAFSR